MLPELALWLLVNHPLAAPADPPRDLGELPLEQLMEIEVVAATKHAQPIFETAAAVFVLRHEELVHAGVRNLPEALRLVPGLTVAQIDANKWAVSVRGFSSRFSDKLLVLIDGRSIYTPTFSGVFWEVQHLPIEEIERIEVIRGPGGALWGANAVNGVINILTRSALESDARRFAVSTGTAEPLAVDWGRTFRLAGGAGLHLWLTAGQADSQAAEGGGDAGDDWSRAGLGFRADWAGGGGSLGLSGAIQWSDIEGRFDIPLAAAPYRELVPRPTELSDSHLTLSWERPLAQGGRLGLQSFLQRERRDELLLDHDLNAVGLGLEWEPRGGGRHRWVLGFDGRVSQVEFHNTPLTAFGDEHLTRSVASVFAQDQFSLAGDRLRVTAGAKVEYHDFIGVNVQPSLRLLARLGGGHTAWAAVSSAVRTPSLAETEATSVWLATEAGPGGVPIEVRLRGNRDLEPERLLSWEAGYRWQVSSALALDLAGFYNRYRDVVSAQLGRARFEPEPPHIVQPITLGQDSDPEASGAELVASWLPAECCRVQASYSYLEVDEGDTTTSRVLSGRPVADEPRDVLHLLVMAELSPRLSLDVALRHSELPRVLTDGSYLGLDLRCGWRLSDRLELELLGRDLLENDHQEYGATEVREPPSVLERELRLALRWSVPR